MTVNISRRKFLTGNFTAEEKDPVYSRDNPGNWLKKVEDFINNAAPDKGLFLSIPDYRPDLVGRISTRIGFEYIDFRERKLIPLRWSAGKMSLDEMSCYLQEICKDCNCIVMNAEALLAARTENERREWFEALLKLDFSNKLVVVLTLFSKEVPLNDRHLTFERDEIPEHGLLKRMLEVKEHKSVSGNGRVIGI